jgi:hypothetical protein
MDMQKGFSDKMNYFPLCGKKNRLFLKAPKWIGKNQLPRVIDGWGGLEL